MNTERTVIQLAIAEDHHLMRESLGRTLSRQSGMQVVIMAAHGRELLDAMAEKPVDVVLMDLDMPIMNGKEALVIIQEKFPDTKVIMFSMHSDPWMVFEIMQWGARSFVPKDSSVNEMVRAIRAVYKYGQYYSTEIQWMEGSNKDESLKMRLSFGTKELEMIQMICDGRTSEEMATLLHLSKKAIDARRADLLKRLEAKNPIDFVRKCMLFALYKPRTDEEIKASDEAREKDRMRRRNRGRNL
ncbi:MAG: hypothetical protein RL521_11 [Bacteroidota bacterium]|jgi:DNA-binding NarL/FixJ family response regulator